MYPGRSIWTRGVLALGAGTLVLSSLQWWIEPTIWTEGDSGGARSIRIVGSKSDGSYAFKQSGMKKGASFTAPDIDEIFRSQAIGSDRRWKRSARTDRRNSGSMIEDTPMEMNVIYNGQRVSPSIGVGGREIDGDELSRRSFRVNEDGGVLGESLVRDQHPVIMRTDAHSNGFDIETRISYKTENKQKVLIEREEGSRNKKHDQAMIDFVTTSTLRNDRSNKDIVEETEPESRSKIRSFDQQESKIDAASWYAQIPRSQESSINADNDVWSSILRHIQNSKDTDNHDILNNLTVTSKSDNLKVGVVDITDGKKARSDHQYKSTITFLDQDLPILQAAGAVAENEEIIPIAFSQAATSDGGIQESNDETEENYKPLIKKRVAVFKSVDRNTAEGHVQRFTAGMQEDQLLFFHADHEQAQSSATSTAEAIDDHKGRSGERDPERRREIGHNWFTRISNQLHNFQDYDDSVHHKNLEESIRIAESKKVEFKDSIIKRDEEDENNNKYNDRKTVFPINKKSRLRDTSSQDLNDSVDNESQNNNKESSDNTNTFQVFDSIIPADNKRGKVTRGEDSKDLMVSSNFIWTSHNQGIYSRALISEYRPILSQNSRKTSRNSLLKRRKLLIDRQKNVQEYRKRTEQEESTAIQKANRHETTIGDRRKRYANYYSAQSATPMAYVHIQPAHPVTPPTNRKCVRCMVVYKPCPSPPRPPPRIVLPKYSDPATKWRGLKYGE